jgi:hypothetical protein
MKAVMQSAGNLAPLRVACNPANQGSELKSRIIAVLADLQARQQAFQPG